MAVTPPKKNKPKRVIRKKRKNHRCDDVHAIVHVPVQDPVHGIIRVRGPGSGNIVLNGRREEVGGTNRHRCAGMKGGDQEHHPVPDRDREAPDMGVTGGIGIGIDHRRGARAGAGQGLWIGEIHFMFTFIH